MYRAGNSVEQVFGGTVIKQGDRTPLGFNFRTENGELVSLTGSTVQVKLASNKGVVLEKQATISDEYTAQFAIGSQDITGAGDMRIEFIVTYPGGTIEKFPSDDWQRIRITPTLEDVEKYGVGYITFEQMKADMDEKYIGFQTQLNEIVKDAGDSNPEIVQARVDKDGNVFGTIKQRIDSEANKIGDLSRSKTDWVNVQEFGAKTIEHVPGFDSTAAIQSAINYALLNGKKLFFPEGTYLIGSKITTYGYNISAFSKITNVDGFSIEGNNAYILDGRNMTSIASYYCPVFLFDACKNIEIKGVHYKCEDTNFTLATSLGYRGASYVTLINNCENIKLDYYVYNARYGVKTGDYNNYQDNGTKGVVNLDAKIKTYMTGYPVAIELGSHIKLDIEADTMHRATYLAGVDNLNLVANVKNIYVANAFVILNYSRYIVNGVTKYKGCSNCDIKVNESGSTYATPDAVLFFIQLYNFAERTSDTVRFSDIRFKGAVSFITSVSLQAFRLDFTSSFADVLDNIEIKYSNTSSSGTGTHFRITTDNTKLVRNLVLRDVVAPLGDSKFTLGSATDVHIRNSTLNIIYPINGSTGRIYVFDSKCADIRAVLSSDVVGDLYLDNVNYSSIGNSVAFSKIIDTKKFEIKSGTTAQRPTGSNRNGMMFFDTTINKPIWRTTTGWVDATGTVV